MFIRRTTIVATACAVLGAGSVAAIAHGDEEPPLRGQGDVQVTTIDEDALEVVAALREARTAGDALPQDLAEPLGRHAKFGMNPGLSRRTIGQTMNSVYLIPANEHVCVALTDGQGVGTTCASTADVAAGEAGPLVATIDEGRGIAVLGIVPDGIDVAALETGTSESQPIAVVNNTYYAVVPAETELRSVRYEGPGGPVSWPIYAPSSVFEDE